MKLILIRCLALFCMSTSTALAVERKVDAQGNVYFEVTSDEIEATNKKPPMDAKQEPFAQKIPEQSYREIALQMKSGCTATEDIGNAGGAVIDLGDFFVVIPTGPNGLPPHPGEDGKLTIHGIDSDNDCVRDDIEHFIAGRFKEESQSAIRKYLFEYAIWLDFFLIEGLNENSARTADSEKGEAGQCLADILGYTKTRTEIDALFAEFHNTFPRTDRYIENAPKIGGWTRRDIPQANCL